MFITLSLFLLVLGVIVTLAQRINSFSLHSSAQERFSEAALLALERMAGEARGATTWLTPPPRWRQPVTKLEFNRPPAASARLPSPAPVPLLFPPELWNPQDPATLTRVTYALSGPTMVRGANSQFLNVAKGVRSFSAQRLASGNMSMTMVLEDGETLSQELWMPLPLGRD